MGVTRIIEKDACLLFGEPDLEVCLSSLGISQEQLHSALKKIFFNWKKVALQCIHLVLHYVDTGLEGTQSLRFPCVPWEFSGDLPAPGARNQDSNSPLGEEADR